MVRKVSNKTKWGKSSGFYATAIRAKNNSLSNLVSLNSKELYFLTFYILIGDVILN